MHGAGIYRIALVQTALRVAYGDGCARMFLYIIYPRAELYPQSPLKFMLPFVLSVAAGFAAKSKHVKQRATLSRLGVETASNSFHLGM